MAIKTSFDSASDHFDGTAETQITINVGFCSRGRPWEHYGFGKRNASQGVCPSE